MTVTIVAHQRRT